MEHNQGHNGNHKEGVSSHSATRHVPKPSGEDILFLQERVSQLSDKSEKMRLDAVKALGERGAEGVIIPLLQVVAADSLPYIRAEAARSVESIVKMFDYSDPKFAEKVGGIKKFFDIKTNNNRQEYEHNDSVRGILVSCAGTFEGMIKRFESEQAARTNAKTPEEKELEQVRKKSEETIGKLASERDEALFEKRRIDGQNRKLEEEKRAIEAKALEEEKRILELKTEAEKAEHEVIEEKEKEKKLETENVDLKKLTEDLQKELEKLKPKDPGEEKKGDQKTEQKTEQKQEQKEEQKGGAESIVVTPIEARAEEKVAPKKSSKMAWAFRVITLLIALAEAGVIIFMLNSQDARERKADELNRSIKSISAHMKSAKKQDFTEAYNDIVRMSNVIAVQYSDPQAVAAPQYKRKNLVTARIIIEDCKERFWKAGREIDELGPEKARGEMRKYFIIAEHVGNGRLTDAKEEYKKVFGKEVSLPLF